MLAAVENLQSSKSQFGSTLALPVANEFVIVVYLPFVFTRVSTDAWPRARTCSDYIFRAVEAKRRHLRGEVKSNSVSPPPRSYLMYQNNRFSHLSTSWPSLTDIIYDSNGLRQLHFTLKSLHNRLHFFALDLRRLFVNDMDFI